MIVLGIAAAVLHEVLTHGIRGGRLISLTEHPNRTEFTEAMPAAPT